MKEELVISWWNMNKNFLIFYIKSQIPLIVFYVLMFLLLVIMNYAYNLPSYFINDVFRYSSGGILTWLFIKMIIDLKKVHQLKFDNHLEKYQIDTPVENQMSLIIKKDRNKLINKLKNKDLKQKNRIDQMDLSSHEIKNDLTTLKINLESQNLNKNSMLEAVNNADYQLDMLLNYEKLFSDSNDFKFEWIYLDDLVEDILKNMSMQFINKQLIPNLNNLKIYVLSDKKWLYFCIEQLLSNAIKYSYDSTKITITFENNQLKVSNTGNTIDSSDIPRIFEKGFTGHNGHNNRLSTGLGLYLVKNICGKLNIRIVAKSYNNNTQFSLIFKKSMLNNNLTIL